MKQPLIARQLQYCWTQLNQKGPKHTTSPQMFLPQFSFPAYFASWDLIMCLANLFPTSISFGVQCSWPGLLVSPLSLANWSLQGSKQSSKPLLQLLQHYIHICIKLFQINNTQMFLVTSMLTLKRVIKKLIMKNELVSRQHLWILERILIWRFCCAEVSFPIKGPRFRTQYFVIDW